MSQHIPTILALVSASPSATRRIAAPSIGETTWANNLRLRSRFAKWVTTVCRPGDREALSHLVIADGAEPHRDRRHHVNRGYRPGRHVVDDPEDADRRQRHHVDQPVDHEVTHAQSAGQRRFITQFAQPCGVTAGICRHSCGRPVVCRWPSRHCGLPVAVDVG